MAGTNNFLIFNEANNPTFTMSDADYLADLYRLNGLIPMIADPVAHNKMYRQWSLMCNAIGAMINDKNLDALDTNSSDLKDNLKLTVKGLARDELSTEITTLGNINTWKESITATPAELNTLDGITASTAELNILDGVTATASELNTLDGVTVTPTEINYLSGASSNIQTQINNLNISALFPLWVASKAYSVGDVVKTLTSSFWVYLECVVAGTSDTTEPTFTNVGELVTDGTAQWLVLDMRDSNPVGTIKQDIVIRDGYLVLNGQTINVVDYPRLVNFLSTNSLIKAYTATPNVTEFTYGDSNNETVILPNFNNLFIESCLTTPYVLEEVKAGLPNVYGSLNSIRSLEVDSNTDTSNNEAITWANDKTHGYHLDSSANATSKKSSYGIKIDASKSDSIYGNSTTVQPPAVKLLPIIKY